MYLSFLVLADCKGDCKVPFFIEVAGLVGGEEVCGSPNDHVSPPWPRATETKEEGTCTSLYSEDTVDT